MKIIGKIKRILGMFLKVSAILSLAILFILCPDLILPFIKMIVTVGVLIWFIPAYSKEEEKKESIAEYTLRTEVIVPPQIFENGHLRR